MITWKIWSALHHPPSQQAVFRRYANGQVVVRRGRLPVFIVIAFLASYLCYQVMVARAPLAVWFWIPAKGEFILLVVLLNLLWGGYLASAISQSIATTRQSGLYELLCLTPPGALGVVWAMGLGTLYRHPGLDWFRFVLTLICSILLIALTILFIVPIIGLGILALRPAMPSNEYSFYAEMFRDLVHAFTLVAAIYTGAVQTVVTAVLVGIIAALTANSPPNARLLSVAVLLLLQLFSFFITLMVYNLLPGVFTLIGLNHSTFGNSFQAALLFAFFFLKREILNAGLWHILQRQVGAEEDHSIVWAVG